MSKIRNRDEMKQLVDFSGLVYDTAQVTDYDGVMEYHDKAWVIFEVKHGKCSLSKGQRLCIERDIDDKEKAGKLACAIIARHDVDNADADVIMQDCRVNRVYFKGKWRVLQESFTVKQVTDAFIQLVDKNVDQKETDIWQVGIRNTEGTKRLVNVIKCLVA